MDNNIIKPFAFAAVDASHLLPAAAANLNFSYTSKKRDRNFRFLFSTQWGSFVFVGSGHRLSITFEEIG
jgi:hypothetical protein